MASSWTTNGAFNLLVRGEKNLWMEGAKKEIRKGKENGVEFGRKYNLKNWNDKGNHSPSL